MQKSGDNEYEKLRLRRIQENKAVLERSGIKNLANTFAKLVESKTRKSKKEKVKSIGINQCDPEYHPNGSEDDEDIDASNKLRLPKKALRSSSRSNTNYIAPQSIRKVIRSSNPGATTKMIAHSEQNEPLTNEEGIMRDLCATKTKATIADMILQKQKSQTHNEAAKEINIAPESSYTTKNLISRSKRVQVDSHGVFTSPQSTSQALVEYEADDSDAEFSHDFDENHHHSEDAKEVEDSHEDIGQVNLNHQDLELDAIFEKNKRGPTMMHGVHTRSLENRPSIILNEFGQPIGPVTETKDYVGEFSRFLGTIARDYNHAPLTIRSLVKVPNKERMWEYVLTKYIVPSEGKEWVLRTIGCAWRVHKCRFKRIHYYKWKNDRERWEHRSKIVPDDEFLKLLALWKNKEEKTRCLKNKEHRLTQKNMHIVGPKSFARVRDQMMNENPNKEPPSLGEMFERTRKRTEGKSYVDSYEDLSKKIEEIQKFTPSEDGKGQTDAFLAIMGKEHNGHRRLYGRGVTNKKLRKVSNSDASYVVPGELMQSIKAGVVEEIQKDMESEVIKIQDMRKEIEADYAKKKSELEQMQTQVENQRGDMFETIMANIISKLPTDIARKYLS